MTKFLPLSQAVADNLNNGDTVAFEGFTHLIPTAAAHEAIRQARKRPDADPHDAGPDLRPDDRHGHGKKVVFSYAGNPGVGLLRRCATRSRTVFRTARDRGAQPRRPWPTPMRRARPACPAPSSAATRAPTCQGQPEHQIGDLSVHRRGAGRRSVDSARRRLHPCAEGRQKGQCAGRRHHRRAEGSGAGRQARRGHGRGSGRQISTTCTPTCACCRTGR
jgi:hypothetical protein